LDKAKVEQAHQFIFVLCWLIVPSYEQISAPQ